jgi:hypothetical protein
MSQHSEDRLEASAPEPVEPRSARVIPFERPQSDLQRAIQVRAQEALDRERDRATKKPAPLRWFIILLAAMVPVALIFGAVDGFLRVFYRVNEIYQSQPAPPQQQPASAPLQSSTPGVVLLQSYENAAPRAPDEPAAPNEEPVGGQAK